MAHTFSSTAATPLSGSLTARKLKLAPRPNFYLMHSPTSWECLETAKGWEWLPRLKQLPAASGVNGVRQTRAGADVRPAMIRFQSEDWTILSQPERVRDGGYVVTTPCEGGLVHHCFYDSFKMVGNSVIAKTDHKAKHDFLRSLVVNGHIPAPEPEILEAIIERQAHRLGRKANNAHIPAVKARLDEDAAKIEAMKVAAGKKPKRAASRNRPNG